MLEITLPGGQRELLRPPTQRNLPDVLALLEQLKKLHYQLGLGIGQTLLHPWGALCTRRIMAMLPVVGGGPATTILEALVAWGAEAKDFEKWQALTESLFIGVGSQPSLIEKLLLADLQQGDTQKNDGNMMPPAKDAEGRLLAQLILLVGGQGALALWGELSAGQLQGLFAEYNTLLNPVQSQRDWAEQMFRAAPQGVLATFDDDIHRWMAD